MPRSGQSLVGKVLIAIDASRRIPLRVEVFGRGSAGLAYSVGFTSLSFGTPAASNFSFTPPPGATVKNQSVPGSLRSALKQAGLSPASLPLLSGGGGVVHSGFSAVYGKQAKLRKAPAPLPIPKKILARINAKFARTLPASMTKAQRAKAIKAFDKQLTDRSGSLHANGGGFVGLPHGQAGRPQVIGKDWLSVIATPPSPQVAAAVQALVTGPGSQPQSQQTGAAVRQLVVVGLIDRRLELFAERHRRSGRPESGCAAGPAASDDAGAWQLGQRAPAPDQAAVGAHHK